MEQISVGLDICAQHPDEQYQYACATGIFMNIIPEYPEKTFAPCDSNRFAAACFRFKTKLTTHFFYKTRDYCFTQPTDYHRRACIWGFAYINPEFTKSKYAYEVCEFYRPENPKEQPAADDYAACFDGFLGSHAVNFTEIGSDFCDDLLPYERAHEICEYYCNTTLSSFTFSSDDEVHFFNYELLEGLYDPSLLGRYATWLPEWNEIAHSPTNKTLGDAHQH